MTPKQSLVLHLEDQHAFYNRGTHQQLMLRHRGLHRQHLTHSHKPDGWVNGGEQTEVLISLSPPKNPGASRNGDRNWVLHVAHIKQGTGYRIELPGTWIGDPDEAKSVACGVLGYQPDWEQQGWGWRVKSGG